MSQEPSRRSFLCTALAVTAAGVSPEVEALAAQSHYAPQSPAEAFHLFSAESLASKTRALPAKGGNDNLFTPALVPLAIVLTTEVHKSAAEFEWHEGRDHIVQVTAGSTRYEVGGTPKDARNIRDGEWLAPASAGATTFNLQAGDMLVIARGTPHKRSTVIGVTFLLISTTGTVPEH